MVKKPDEYDTVEVDGTTVSVPAEFRVERDSFGVESGIYGRIKDEYEADSETFYVIEFANGVGPSELDISARRIAAAVGDGIVSAQYDTEMHD